MSLKKWLSDKVTQQSPEYRKNKSRGPYKILELPDFNLKAKIRYTTRKILLLIRVLLGSRCYSLRHLQPVHP